MIGEDILSELEDFQAWRARAPGPFALIDYAGCIGTPDFFFAFLDLARPSLLRHEGAWFIESRFDSQAFQRWKDKGYHIHKIQRVMNHIHMSTLFQQQEVDDRVSVRAASVLAEIWSAVFRDIGAKGVALGETFTDAAATLVDTTETVDDQGVLTPARTSMG